VFTYSLAGRVNKLLKMKIFVRTLVGTQFEIEVNPEHTVADVKKIINIALGQVFYSDAQQMRIHSYKGKILEDTKTLEENDVAHNSFLVVIFSGVPMGNLV
ncbi:hypothetical protein AABB24_023735, partial [Solanum stoloniferum]